MLRGRFARNTRRGVASEDTDTPIHSAPELCIKNFMVNQGCRFVPNFLIIVASHITKA